MTSKLNPCYLCKRRTTFCHGSCKDYIDWKSKWEADRQKRMKDNLIEQRLRDNEVSRAIKIRKGRSR